MPPAILGFRSAHHAEAAALVPGAEVVIEPTFVTALLPDVPGEVLACGPEPMLEAVRRLAPQAQLAVGGPDGLRIWSLLRMRGPRSTGACSGSASRGRCSERRDRHARRREWLPRCAHRAGCGKYSWNAFVTKTITPGAAGGQRAGQDRGDRVPAC